MLLAQVLPRPQLIFLSKTWFFKTFLNFQWKKSFLNRYLPHSESKSYQINSIKSCSSRSFQLLRNFEWQFNLIFSEKIIQYSKTFPLQFQLLWNQAHAPLLAESFSKTHDLKHPSSMDLITTKQTTFIDRLGDWWEELNYQTQSRQQWVEAILVIGLLSPNNQFLEYQLN